MKDFMHRRLVKKHQILLYVRRKCGRSLKSQSDKGQVLVTVGKITLKGEAH